ncbi:hypothetical protein LY76DRAFT_649294 [Colletotrichum caudatum]|nr:hypothetical protein LY76DRAFT_649294 [Colletotrichum caudatum]
MDEIFMARAGAEPPTDGAGHRPAFKDPLGRRQDAFTPHGRWPRPPTWSSPWTGARRGRCSGPGRSAATPGCATMRSACYARAPRRDGLRSGFWNGRILHSADGLATLVLTASNPHVVGPQGASVMAAAAPLGARRRARAAAFISRGAGQKIPLTGTAGLWRRTASVASCLTKVFWGPDHPVLVVHGFEPLVYAANGTAFSFL